MSGNLSWFRAVHRGAIAQFSGAAGFASPLVVSPVPLPVIVSAAVHDDVADDGRVPLLVETLQRLVVDVGRRGAGILLKKAAVHLALPLPTRREAASEPLRTPAAQVPLQEWARAFAMIDAGQSVTKTAKQCNMGFCTLWRRHNARDCGKRTPGPATVLGEKGEALLTNFLLMRQRIGNCVTMDEFRLTAKRIAAALSVEGFVAGKTWEANWWRRHPGLAKRTAENTERARGYAVNEFTITEFFDVLDDMGEKVGKQWWCADEWGIDLLNTCALNVRKRAWVRMMCCA